MTTTLHRSQNIPFILSVRAIFPKDRSSVRGTAQPDSRNAATSSLDVNFLFHFGKNASPQAKRVKQEEQSSSLDLPTPH